MANIISTADIEQASGGNPALRNMLLTLANGQNTTATKINTSGKLPPNQSSATVSYQAPFYVVNITDPGGAAAQSLTQAAQLATNPLGTNATQSVIYHQVQAATSVLFDAPSSLTTFGGDTGSLQTQFMCTGLDSTQQWYFRIRTSYDGATWNQWRNINNGTAVIASPYAPQLSAVTGGSFLGLTLPGQQIVGFGVGQLLDGELIASSDTVLIENTVGLVGPAGVNDLGDQAIGVLQCTAASTGQVSLLYTAANQTTWTGAVNFLTFGWDPNGNQSPAEQTLADNSRWVVAMVSGGSQIAVGTGVSTPGQAIDFPSGFSAANCLAICTPASVTPPNGHDAHGIAQCDVVIAGSTATPTVLYGDGSGNRWTGNANWFVLAWQPTLAPNVVNVAGGKYIIITTPSGRIAFGQGKTPSGQIMPLPAGGYSYDQCLAFSTLDGYNDIGNYMHGVLVCSVDVGLTTSVGTCTGLYTNGTTNVWTGNLQWFSIAWL